MRRWNKQVSRFLIGIIVLSLSSGVVGAVALHVPRAIQPFFNPYLASTTTYTEPTISAEDVKAAIDEYRQENSLPPFSLDEAVCSIIDVIPSDPNLVANEEVFDACPKCSRIALLSVSTKTPPQSIMAQLQETDTRKLLDDSNYSHLCAKEKAEQVLVTFAAFEVKNIVPPKAPDKQPKNFTEDQIWQALVDYRHAHKKTDLLREESLCVYARKRVEDHITMLKEVEKKDYPNQDKYPLDAHAGFQKDAESGYAFEVAGKNQLAENLAYWPDAEYPHQVIEWGWDTSTEGHRETQLSNEYTHACITGKSGFYVAIFGK